MGYSGGSLEDQNTKGSVDSGGLVSEVLVVTKDYLSIYLSGTELEANHVTPWQESGCVLSTRVSLNSRVMDTFAWQRTF